MTEINGLFEEGPMRDIGFLKKLATRIHQHSRLLLELRGTA
jgi:hypothetical protein